MTTWILLLVMLSENRTPNVATSIQVTFQSEKSCYAAAKQLDELRKPWNGYFNAYCFENAPEPKSNGDSK